MFEDRLRNAADSGDENAIKAILAQLNDIKPIIDSKNTDGLTALHLAAAKGHQHIISLLLKNGANIENKNSVGRTPLHSASGGGKVEAIRILLENGANIEATTDISNHRGDTPLHDAARSGDLATIKFLLEKGSNYKALNKDKKTPSMWAEEAQKPEVARFIINYHHQLKLSNLKRLTSLTNDKLELIEQQRKKITQLEEGGNKKITQLESQVHLLNKINDKYRKEKELQRFSFFKPSFVVGTTLVTVFFFMGLLQYLHKEETRDKSGITGEIIMALCIIIAISYLTRQVKNAHEELSSMIKGARKETLLLVQSLRKTFEAGKDTIKETQEVLKTLNGTLMTAERSVIYLSTKAGNVLDETSDMIVTIKDETKNALVDLRGDAKEIAMAIDNGIKEGRFQPKADVKVDVNASATICAIM